MSAAKISKRFYRSEAIGKLKTLILIGVAEGESHNFVLKSFLDVEYLKKHGSLIVHQDLFTFWEIQVAT